MRKYQKTTGYWVYGHITPNGMIYIGMSKLQPCERWKKSKYKDNSLAPYITEYGWENIEHKVFIDGLTKEQAKTLEDLLILQARKDNWCINTYRSGNIRKDSPIEYQKNWYEQHKNSNTFKEHRKLYSNQYHKSYDIIHREDKIERMKKYRSTPEGKIYNRVASYNYYHPDKVIETPMEAKQKYLQWGYIPNYIKNDDLA